MRKFVLVEPHDELCSLLLGMLTNVVAGKGEVVAINSFMTATEKIPRYKDVAMVFISFDTSTEQGALTARQIKTSLPDTKVILTGIGDLVQTARTFGLDGFISKGGFFPPKNLREFIKENGIEL